MKAIAVETTTRLGQAALVEGGEVVAVAEFPAGLRHAASLVAEVDRLLRDAGWRAADVDAVYVSVGPGSFTGTRIGVTFAKTFAFAAGARVVAVPTAAVIGANVEDDATVVVLDARRGSVWWAADGGRAAGVVSTPAGLLERLPRPAVLVGEGVAYHREALVAEGVALADEAAAVPRVEVVARLAATMGEADARALVPIYVRRPEAEEKRLGG